MKYKSFEEWLKQFECFSFKPTYAERNFARTAYEAGQQSIKIILVPSSGAGVGGTGGRESTSCVSGVSGTGGHESTSCVSGAGVGGTATTLVAEGVADSKITKPPVDDKQTLIVDWLVNENQMRKLQRRIAVLTTRENKVYQHLAHTSVPRDAEVAYFKELSVISDELGVLKEELKVRECRDYQQEAEAAGVQTPHLHAAAH